MTIEWILRRAVNSMAHGHHAPYCGHAASLNDVENIDYAKDYAEPGYDTPQKGILFANWNGFPRNLDTILERYGYAVEWSDEWATCEDCSCAFRTQPDSMWWRPVYSWDGECSLVCRDCLQERYPTSEDCE